jgi:transcriptional regulator with XRE-family HTH domain
MNKETTRVKIGQQLRALRQERGLSTRQLAEITGVIHSHIVRIESGRYNVGVDTVEKLANALGAKLTIRV